jgi:hypothetical protein
VRRDLPDILGDDRSGFAGLDAAKRGGRRLHRDRRGQVSVLFILVGLAFFVAASMVWNTGVTTAARMHAQTAADSAAYSSTVWTSRTVNQVTGTNMLIMRNASAFVAASAAVWTTAKVPENWDAAIEAAAAIPIVGPEIAAALAAYIAAVELPMYLEFVAEAIASMAAPTVLAKVFGRIPELHRYEKAWVAATPDVIDRQRELLEQYYGCEIRLTRPGDRDGRVRAPLKQPDVATGRLVFGTVLATRFFLLGHDNGWYRSTQFSAIVIGEAKEEWRKAALVAAAAATALWGDQHFELDLPYAVGELGPRTSGQRAKFTVVATARMSERTRGRLMAPGAFRWPVAPHDRILAYAQAETNNGIDGRLEKFPGIGTIVGLYPFRVWTTYGWQWQPRLAHGDQLGRALRHDGDLRQWYGEIGVTPGSNLDDIALH